MRTPEDIIIDPRSIVVIGASENRDKIGGRPLRFMLERGYAGKLYAVNPNRGAVQGVPSFPGVRDLPEAPELAYVAVAGQEAVQAVKDCADRGVKAALVISAGFGETGPEGRAAQDEMVAYARARNMRVIGPNSQGLANFGSNAIPSFSTMFVEIEPLDGPVAVISQSGGMSQMAYGLLRERGIGVRHVHATGNEADVTISDLACAIARDPAVKVLLLYLEAIPDPWRLAQAARIARERGVAVVAVKSGRTAQGQKAALSHTGAMANEDRVVDAFLRKHGIWRAEDIPEQLRCVPMYLKGWQPRSRQLAIISNSGASCVMGADIAASLDLPLAPLSEATRAALAERLPGFAATGNPIDITAALLSNSGLFGSVLPAVAQDSAVHLVLIQIPVSGAGYDVPAFARDTAAFMRASGLPVAVCVWQESAAGWFRAAGVPTFAATRDALAALAQLAGHRELIARAAAADPPPPPPPAAGEPARPSGFLDEADSLARLAAAGIPAVPHSVCRAAEQAREAFARHGPRVAVKACSASVPHKSEHGLVALNIRSADDAAAAFQRQMDQLAVMGAAGRAVIVAAMAGGQREFMIGARRDPVFGPVVMVGDGGKYVETLRDFALLLPPFQAGEAERAIRGLRIGPLLDGARGDPPVDVEAVARIAAALGELMLQDPGIVSVDINPVIAGARGEGALAADALLEV
jgi:acyl-CoA synthetase (NDP forming)